MGSTLRIIFLLCLSVIITGCELIIQPWSITKKDQLTEERQNIVETMIGASKDQVTEILGNPDSIYTDKTQKYLIYSSQSASDLFLTFIFVMPIAYDSNYDNDGTLNCIKIDLDSKDKVTSYEFDSSLQGQCLYCNDDCLDAFWTSTEQNSLVRLDTGKFYKNRFVSDPRSTRWQGDAKWQGDKVARTYCPNADLGHTDAQRYIADIYYEGALGHAADPVRAWVWYSLAAQNGDVQAADQLARVSTELTPEQIDEAKRQLALWKPGQCMQELMP
jgi:TPR repeat protein